MDDWIDAPPEQETEQDHTLHKQQKQVSDFRALCLWVSCNIVYATFLLTLMIEGLYFVL